MAITADFTVSSRVGDRFNTVTFTDLSTGTIVSRKWIVGDGTVYEGNDTTIKHTYLEVGSYTVTLVVQSTTEQDSETKENYIIVNDVRPVPSFIIMQSFPEDDAGYWKLYLDINLYLYFETRDFLYRTINRVADVAQWCFVQFDYASEKLYVGTGPTFYREMTLYKTPNPGPISEPYEYSEIAPNSTLKLDELKLWSKEKSQKEYYMSTRAKAIYLDSL